MLTVISLLFILWGSALAQDSPKHNCPTVTITAPSDVPLPGAIIVFTAKLAENAPPNITYTWFLSNGEILVGQGTPSLHVRAPKSYGDNVTVTVKVGGLPEGCIDHYSETAPVCRCAEFRLVDEYETLTFSAESKRLDAAISKVEHDEKVVIIKYFPKTGRENRSEISRVRNYLQNVKKLSESEFRLVIVTRPGPKLTKIYLVPKGVMDPIP